MNQEQEKNNHFFEDEQDPFTRFMFGDRIRKDHQPTKSVSESDDWIFSGQDRSDNNDNKQKEELPFAHLLDHIDVNELMKNIDTLMSTASQFKPLWEKITPIVNKWKK